MDDDSQLLVNYARRGDVKSLSALVVRHATWMQALLCGMLRSAADAEDAFQEAWRRVIKSAANYRGGSVRSYLAAAARTSAIDLMRRRGEAVSLDGFESEEGPVVEAVDPALPPDARYELKAGGEEVRAAVRGLPAGPRQVVLLRIEGGLPFKEIAAELGVPLGTALTWMHVATERLKKAFTERE